MPRWIFFVTTSQQPFLLLSNSREGNCENCLIQENNIMTLAKRYNEDRSVGTRRRVQHLSISYSNKLHNTCTSWLLYYSNNCCLYINLRLKKDSLTLDVWNRSYAAQDHDPFSSFELYCGLQHNIRDWGQSWAWSWSHKTTILHFTDKNSFSQSSEMHISTECTSITVHGSYFKKHPIPESQNSHAPSSTLFTHWP